MMKNMPEVSLGEVGDEPLLERGDIHVHNLNEAGSGTGAAIAEVVLGDDNVNNFNNVSNFNEFGRGGADVVPF
jgi:hypothetical protein